MRSELQQLFNFMTTEDGEVNTYFDGRVTQSQLIVAIVCVVALLFCIAFLKKLAKIVCILVLVGVMLVHYGASSPIELNDIASTIQSTGTAYYEKVANSSDSVKFEDNTVSVKIDGNWYNVKDIQSIVSGSEGVLTVIIDGESHTVDNSYIIEVLKTFTK